jgi:hypothetical protein
METQLETRSQQDAIRSLAFALAEGPTVEIEPVHRFAPGLYVRELTVPAGCVIVGKVHKHESVNILVKGSALLACDGRVEKVSAPLTFVSGPGRQKAAYVLEDMTWINVHPTQETDLVKIEAEFIEKDEGFEAHKLQLETLRKAIQTEES